MSEFTDKVVLVTGAGKGLGRAIAEAFAAQGARVAANDVTPINLDETVRRIQLAGGQVKDYVFDMAKKMPVQAMIAQILDDWGRIDVLVNNAGVQPHMPLLDMDEWDWHRTLDVNLSGPFFAIQTVGRVMRQAGGGVIVNIAASAGCAQSLKDCSAYVASKMGLVGLTQAAALELAPYHIRIYAVCPGEIQAGAASVTPQAEDLVRKPLQDKPPGIPAALQDAVGLVLFLCSSAAAGLTGQAIDVDMGGNPD
jgi:NAD(P)-dependent dehydrogenase (short-subunit alcohol dehydrogenase family)